MPRWIIGEWSPRTSNKRCEHTSQTSTARLSAAHHRGERVGAGADRQGLKRRAVQAGEPSSAFIAAETTSLPGGGGVKPHLRLLLSMIGAVGTERPLRDDCRSRRR